MAIEDDIMYGEIFGADDQKDKIDSSQVKAPKIRRPAKTMAEATMGLKTLDTQKKKSKSGTFAKGTHGSGAAKMRAEYKNKSRKRNSK